MNDERQFIVLIHPSSLILHPFRGRRSQVVRQRSAKPLFIGSIPIAASNNTPLQKCLQPEDLRRWGSWSNHVAGTLAGSLGLV